MPVMMKTFSRLREYGRAGHTLIAALLMSTLLAACNGANQTETASDGPSGSAAETTSAMSDPRPYRFSQARALPAIPSITERQHIDLSGEWNYVIDVTNEGFRSFIQSRSKGNLVADISDAEIGPTNLKEYDLGQSPTMRVPGSWTSQVDELHWYDGTVWYRTTFDGMQTAGNRQVLQFEAVNYHATVFLNGEVVGEHYGGFTPFAFDVTDLVVEGENSLVVAVDALRTSVSIPPSRYDWQNFAGITRPVYLASVPETHIDTVWVRLANADTIAVDIQLLGPDSAGSAVELEIPGLAISETLETGSDGTATLEIEAPEQLALWSPDTPSLYDVEIRSGGDRFTDRIGFRTIEVQGDDILLNGEPIFLRGISLHEESLGEMPERIHSADQARPLLEEIKNGLGGNFVRLSHYPHSETTVRLAEEMGLLVWSEIPVYWDIAFDNPAVLDFAIDMLDENMRRDMNRAAVFVWSVGNETPISDERNVFMQALADHARGQDGSRLVSMAMNTVRLDGSTVLIDDPMVSAVDFLAVNFYEGWYGGRQLDSLSELSFERVEDKPLVFSEFGAGALLGFNDPDTRRKFSEEFQADYYSATLAMIENIPYLRGASPWILKDFRAPRRPHPVYQDYWNRKGIISPSGERKLAFGVLADWYASELPQDASDNPE